MSVISLLGATLRKPDGTIVPTSEALKDKDVLGLYFSAHWCPPCRGFTPTLSEKYTALQEAGKSLELVFVSSDRDESAFDEYHKEMTFLALPYAERDAKAKLSKKFKVSGIPSLVFVDAKTGALITDEGREVVSSEKYIENFPYTPKKVNVITELGATLRKPDGTIVPTSEALKDKDVLGLYFSAHWCPPCRGFTPTLSEKYTALQEAGKSLELVFVSSDRDESAFDEYHKEMTFLALPYAERDAKQTLSKHFKVSGIPSLVFVDAKTGAVITDEGRGGIESPTFVADFPYHPKPVNDLSGSTSGINDSVSLLVLMENAPAETQKDIQEMLQTLAEAELSKDEEDITCEKFFTGCGGGPLAQVRKGCDCAGDKAAKEPQMLILDLGNSGAYYHPNESDKAVNAGNIKLMLEAFKTNKLERHQFGS